MTVWSKAKIIYHEGQERTAVAFADFNRKELKERKKLGSGILNHERHLTRGMEAFDRLSFRRVRVFCG